MIVTLGRQCGCAGDEVGKKLSELLWDSLLYEARADRSLQKKRKFMKSTQCILVSSR